MDEAQKKMFRSFLKDSVRLTIDFSLTDQHKRIAPPPVQKPYPADAGRIDLVRPDELRTQGTLDVFSAIENRRSRRDYKKTPLTLKELSFLCWATQGIRDNAAPGTAFRTVPSAGCRHAFEAYLCVLSVEGLQQGIYRYLPVEHQLLLVSNPERPQNLISQAALGQSFIGKAAVVFVWTTVPYRMEWRYDIAAHKVIAIDAGHVCQNLYLACEAIGAGTCAVAAYDQESMDRLLGVDGEDEFTIYLAPVGKV